VTSFVRKVAGGLTVVEAIALIYAYFDVVVYSCPANGCPGPSFIPTYSVVTLGLAAMLLIVGALGVWGAPSAYLGGAVLSAAALLVTGYTVAVTFGHGYLSTASDDAIIAAAFALVALVVNIEAARSKGGISEQANPMNLPVFG
jgi:hypothetical protein